jgi:hypothetical protein
METDAELVAVLMLGMDNIKSIGRVEYFSPGVVIFHSHGVMFLCSIAVSLCLRSNSRFALRSGAVSGIVITDGAGGAMSGSAGTGVIISNRC